MSGGFAPRLTQTSFGVDGEVAFLASEHYSVKRDGVTLNAAAVVADVNGDKILASGTLVTPDNTGLYVPYSGVTDEAQTITIGGSGLTSFTLTFAGQTTTALDVAATAQQIEDALVALSNIGLGDVVVTGNVGGPFTVVFAGTLADTDVAEMTATPTGGTGTVTIATTIIGGAAGTPAVDPDVSGYLLESYNLKGGNEIGGIVIHGSVLSARVHPALDATIRAALKGRITFQ